MKVGTDDVKIFPAKLSYNSEMCLKMRRPPIADGLKILVLLNARPLGAKFV